MKWFLNLRTRTKLLLGFGATTAFLAAIIATGYGSIREIRQSLEVLFQEDSALSLHMEQLDSNLNKQQATLLTMISLPMGTDLSPLQQELMDISRQNDDILKHSISLRRNDPAYRKAIGRIVELRGAYKQTWQNQIVPAILEGKFEEEKASILGIQHERYLQIRNLTLEVGGNARKRSREALEKSEQRADLAVIVFMIVGSMAVLTGIAIVVVLNNIIARPLRQISSSAERIASGDLSAGMVGGDRSDEVGGLAQAFDRMTSSLQDMAAIAQQIAGGDLRLKVAPQSDKDVLGNAFAAMVANLQRMTVEISESVALLSSAANGISVSTVQFANSATETAAAVNETTTTVEEIRQTAQVAHQKTKLVSDSAQRTVLISQGGKTATELTIEGMNRIREQMNAIAESMTMLSEQTQAVGQIISTVDDLAQQSNLLAVNASIEAAKAGEQGKGFAVVAQEVKNLADQSKQATARVRAILSDIQRATNAAVMATEQGSKAVEAGVLQSTQAGEAILTLANSIGEAAQAATQIAASSQQQVVGMDQLAEAIENIKTFSIQNVTGAKQLETSAHNLTELGGRLGKLVGRFQM